MRTEGFVVLVILVSLFVCLFATSPTFADPAEDMEGDVKAVPGQKFVYCTFTMLNADGEMVCKFKGETRYFKITKDTRLTKGDKAIVKGDLRQLEGKPVLIYHTNKNIDNASFYKED